MQGQRPSALIQEFNAQPQGDGGPVEFDLPDDSPNDMLTDGALVAPANDDGSVEIQLDAEPAPGLDPEVAFSANLALIPNLDIDGIASEVCDAIEDDIKSRADWSEALKEGIQLLGVKKEKMTKPFPNACGVWDPMMAEATIRFWATFHGEMLPAKGPVKTEIIGIIQEMAEERGNRVRDWMNYYLTKVAKEFYPDMDQLGFWLPLAGSMFKKVYQCPIKNRPVSPFIMAQDVIVPYQAANLANAQRVTVVNHMSRRDIKLRWMKQIWREIVLGEPVINKTGDDAVKDTTDRIQGISPQGAWRGDEVFDVYEVDLDLDLTQHGAFRTAGKQPELEGLPLPYKLIIEKESRRALALTRNWRKGDTSFEKRREMVHYKFLPGVGFYGFGYSHVLGSLATTGTAIRRQIIDACTLSMFPGGMRTKGMKFDSNNKMIGPSEFPEVDTGGLPINQAVMLIPRPELSQIPILALQENSESARVLASNVEIAVGEGRQDAPVGTTLALMEGANKLVSASLKLAHVSFGEELEIFAEIFGRVLPNKPYPFPVQGGQQAIMRQDFSEHVQVIPVSDPEIVTNTQRIMRAQALKQSAIEAPQIHDMREAYRMLYIAMDVDEAQIDLILPKPQQAVPLDPLSENQLAIIGGMLKAGPEQDHQSHIEAHEMLQEIPAMMAHIAEHMALKMRADVERILGSPLPPMGQPLPPQIEGQIAMMVAKAMKVLREEQGKTMTPDDILREEIKQEWAKIANAAQKVKQDAEVKSYTARMKFNQADRDRDSRERMEILKAAANTADNKVPPIEYVQSVLDIGLQHAPEKPTKEGAPS